jgi:glutathione S-transferase
MKLYTHLGAPNPRRVQIFLAEKRIDVPIVPVDLMTRANRTPEMLARNPYGGLPVLELDDGSHLAESVAICRYLEALHPAPALFGRTPAEIGRVEMWIRRVELGIAMHARLAWIHGSPITKPLVKQQLPEVAELAREGVRESYDLLDGGLRGARYFAGDAFTMADVVALTVIDFAAARLDAAPAPRHAELLRWHADVSARPSVKG